MERDANNWYQTRQSMDSPAEFFDSNVTRRPRASNTAAAAAAAATAAATVPASTSTTSATTAPTSSTAEAFDSHVPRRTRSTAECFDSSVSRRPLSAAVTITELTDAEAREILDEMKRMLAESSEASRHLLTESAEAFRQELRLTERRITASIEGRCTSLERCVEEIGDRFIDGGENTVGRFMDFGLPSQGQVASMAAARVAAASRFAYQYSDSDISHGVPVVEAAMDDVLQEKVAPMAVAHTAAAAASAPSRDDLLGDASPEPHSASPPTMLGVFNGEPSYDAHDDVIFHGVAWMESSSARLDDMCAGRDHALFSAAVQLRGLVTQ